MTLVLYTIGHSNIPIEEFLANLRRYNVTVLVDVRSAPYSRYVPHFNKSNLEAYLKENNVDYRFAGEWLGGRPKDTDLYQDNTVPADDAAPEQSLRTVRHNDIMKRDGYQKGIQRLLEIVSETSGHVAIMCSEGDPHDCHRHHLITRSLVDPKLKFIDEIVGVQHILRDGNIEIVDESAFDEPSEQLKLL
jgi:uncharacterized protein (DUF488 family)